MASFTSSLGQRWNLSSYDLLPASPDVEQQPQQDSIWPQSIRKRPIVRALLQFGILFALGSLILGGALYCARPPLDTVDRETFRIPTSFDELKALNVLLKKLKVLYPMRTLTCFIVTYFYLQAFSLPGSMYLSILAGAVWGVPIALPLCCFCVATGASLCYLLSACVGPALLSLPRFKDRIDSVVARVDEPSHRANIVPYMIVLRMAPLPPHWAINIACPHLGIGLAPFWLSAFLGIGAVSVIHTTIGVGLDQMTSPEDFHLFAPRNALLLSLAILAACIPIFLRHRLSSTASLEQEMSEHHHQLLFDEEEETRLREEPVGSLGLIGLGIGFAPSMIAMPQNGRSSRYGRPSSPVPRIHVTRPSASGEMGFADLYAGR